MNWTYAGLALSFFAMGSVNAAPEHAAGLMNKVDEVVLARMQHEKTPGVAVAIIKNGAVVATKGYGYADLEHRVPVTKDTLFESGSVGKQFTAAAVMLQVEEAKLSLEDPITKYFTDAPPSWRSITVRNLLNHTSGIADFTEKDLDYRHDYSEEDLAKAAYKQTLEFEPGSRWSYSNTGYVLLGILVHKVSGKFYGDVLKERVFAPLGMKTAQVINEDNIVPNRAAGYRLVQGELKNQEWVSPTLNTTADGSLYLSILDYAAWDRGLRAHAILKPQSWAQIYTPVRLKSGKTYPYGFGWDVEESQGKPWYHHGGAWQGFRTYISRYLGDDLTIVVLTNSADADPDRYVDAIASVIDPALAKINPSTPIPDSDPATTERARKLLAKATEGQLTPQDVPHTRAGLLEHANEISDFLKSLGEPQHLDLVSRRTLGEDTVSTYLIAYKNRTARMMYGVAPDGGVSVFYVVPE